MGLAGFAQTGGVTLTETLVAILVMSSGALGLAGLQAENLRAGRDAYQRSVAVQRAADMLDRIRANRAVTPGGFAVDEGPPVLQDCVYAACDPTAMARFDVAVWKCALGAWRETVACAQLREAGTLAAADAMPGLSEGDGTVVFDGVTGVVTVTVTWGPRDGASRPRVALASRV